MLDDRGFTYTRKEEELTITFTLKGEDIPMDMFIIVKPKQQIVSIFSPMPFNVPKEKRTELAVAVNIANFGLADGSFDYDFFDGYIRFRLTSSYKESILSKDLFDYMLMASAYTTDNYNDRFMMLSKGLISIEQFIDMEKRGN